MSSDKPNNFAAMKALYEKSPYEPTTSSSLESYVIAQMTDGKYDFDANKTLLKIYQCFPETANIEIIANILVLSLMRLPSTDFLMISYLVPAKFSVNSKIKFIQKCADYLESGKFVLFWESCVDGTVAEITMNANFRKQIRTFIVASIRDTFRSIEKGLFSQMLGLEPSEFDSFCNTCPDVEKVTGDAVILSSRTDSTGRAKTLEESVRFEEMLRLTESIRA